MGRAIGVKPGEIKAEFDVEALAEPAGALGTNETLAGGVAKPADCCT
jgi:hypothetical protein